MNIAPSLPKCVPAGTRTLLVIASLWLCAVAHAGIPIQHWTQSSGAKMYLVESHAIPMVDVQIDFDAGTRRDPVSKAGLASVTAGMLGKGVRAHGGAAAMDENALGEAWADLGANFGVDASSDRLSASLRSLSYPDLLTKAAQLAARELGEPTFPKAVWERERQRLIASIKEANTQPATVANRAFNKAVYSGHPYGFEPTEATLLHIDLADMYAMHKAAFLPCRAKISIVGDVTREQADTLAATLMARLPSPTACNALPTLPNVSEVPALAASKEETLPFSSAQAHVLIGQTGYKRDDPDHFALTVGNYILGGGGFVSRLTEEVREKRGLSYSVYSYFAPGWHAGAFTVGLQTRPDQASEAVKVAKDVLAQFVNEGPTQAELKAAKDNLIGGFALRIDNNRKLLDNVANIAWYNLPLTYLDNWTAQVDKLTIAEIKAAFQRKLQPSKMVTVIVGATP